MRHVIALDVGGTAMKAALYDAAGTLLHEARRPTSRERGPAAVTEGVLDFAAELRAYGERELGQGAAAVGVVVPGVIDAADGRVIYATNLDWRDVPLRDLLSTRLGIPATLGHDVAAGGLAESRLGAARGTDRFFFIALGTGIAGAIGLPGARVETAEIGHVTVRENGLTCPCGSRGCLERYASAAAVSAAWGGDAADCAKAVEAGDEKATRVWTTAVAALADALMTAVTLLTPDTLIVGGGLSEAGETLLHPLREALEARATFQRLPKVVRAELGDTAGCRGAGVLAWDLLTKTDSTEEPR